MVVFSFGVLLRFFLTFHFSLQVSYIKFIRRLWKIGIKLWPSTVLLTAALRGTATTLLEGTT